MLGLHAETLVKAIFKQTGRRQALAVGMFMLASLEGCLVASNSSSGKFTRGRHCYWCQLIRTQVRCMYLTVFVAVLSTPPVLCTAPADNATRQHIVLHGTAERVREAYHLLLGNIRKYGPSLPAGAIPQPLPFPNRPPSAAERGAGGRGR